MQIYGSFTNQQDERITVSIVTGGSVAVSKEIGTAAAGIWFADDPVEIESQVNDTFDHLLLTQATVRLLCRNYEPQLFASSCLDVSVVISRDGEVVFAGFVEPMSLSQGYNADVDEVELTCIDRLCALSYARYGFASGTHAEQRKQAEQRTWISVIASAIKGATPYGVASVPRIWYDGSKAESSKAARRYDILSRLTCSDLLFLGEKETDTWSMAETVEEMLRYLNLHMVQMGADFYLFSWETLRSGRTVAWRDLMGGDVKEMGGEVVTISMDNVASDDATINVGEVYSQIALTARIEDVEEVVESPLDDDQLSSPYSRRQLYMVEYAADKGSGAYWAMRDMVKGGGTDYGGASKVNWHVQVMQSAAWRFPMEGDEEHDLVSYFLAHGGGQHSLPRWLGSHIGAALMKVGSAKERISSADSSPEDRPNMQAQLVISVNGNERDTEAEAEPSAATLRASVPLAVYEGASGGGSLSPSDDKVTNYVVISGKMVLNPVMHASGFAEMQRFMGEVKADGSLYFDTELYPSRTCKDGRYYTRQYMAAATPGEEPVWKDDGDVGWYPYTGGDKEYYQYNYSAVGDGSDRVAKVGCLACMLIVGDKCAVETGTSGTAADITWQAYKERKECATDDEYYQQSFTIGFDPKRGDCLVGKEYDLQNTVTDAMGIDADGIAIPVRRSDRVSGQVRFIILGVCYTLWDDVTRRHPTFFRHTSWRSTSVPLMAHVSSIIMKDFSVKAYTDNGLQDHGGESSDIVYMSSSDAAYRNRKDDVEMRINSALTTEECNQLKVKNRINLSTPISADTGTGVLSIFNRWKDEQVKPEQDYIDSFYTEWHLPRVTLTQKLQDKPGFVSLLHLYRSPAMGLTFHVVGISRNLMEGWAQLTLKQVP